MDLHDSGKFKLRRHLSGGGWEGAENSRDYAKPFGTAVMVLPRCG